MTKLYAHVVLKTNVCFTAMKASAKKASQTQIASAVIVILVIVGATAYAYYAMQKQGALPGETETKQFAPGEPTPEPTPTPTPTKLWHGKDTYSVSGGDAPGPDISEVSFDPLDPAVGATQIITVNIADSVPVTEAYVSMRTDTKTTKVSLTRTNGTEFGGTWEARWNIPESYLYNYIPTVVAKSSSGETKIPITIRERK